MNKLLLLLFASSIVIGMAPATQSINNRKVLNGYKFTGHIQERMLKRSIDESAVFNALQKGMRCNESDEIELCIYSPEKLVIVIANKKTLVTVWKDKSIGACRRKLKSMLDSGTPVTQAILAKFKQNEVRWMQNCLKRMEERHMAKDLVTEIIHTGKSYPTYSGARLFVRLPHAVLFKEDSVSSVFTGINQEKLSTWKKNRDVVMDKSIPQYVSNHPVTVKSLKKKLTKANADLIGD